MEVVLLVLLVVTVGAAAAFAAVEVTRRRYEAAAADGPETAPVDTPPVEVVIQQAVTGALDELRARSAVERDAAVRAALEQAAVLQREQLGTAAAQVREQSSSELAAKKDVIDARLDQVHAEMRGELHKLGQMVASLAETSAQKFGQVDQSLRSHAEVTQTLSESARALREAMASPTARGQWGERMA
ncbi:MAG: DNA recombination protein RmuC, partial [Acidimicrobiia bacterium]